MDYIRSFFSSGTAPTALRYGDFDFSLPYRIRITTSEAGEKGGLVAFEMAWCKFCQKNDVVLKALATAHPEIAVMVLEGTSEPAAMHAVSRRGLIKGFPTVFKVNKGGYIELDNPYGGEPTTDGYAAFLGLRKGSV